MYKYTKMSTSDIFNNMNEQLFTSKVTISVEQRNGKKCTTRVIGMDKELDLKKIVSFLKRKHNCSGSIVKHETHGEVMMFSGDQKENVYNFLINEEIYKKDDIIIQGV